MPLADALEEPGAHILAEGDAEEMEGVPVRVLPPVSPHPDAQVGLLGLLVAEQERGAALPVRRGGGPRRRAPRSPGREALDEQVQQLTDERSRMVWLNALLEAGADCFATACTN